MEELIQQPTRARILDVVRAHPGASGREIQRQAGLAWGETAYHLDQLTKAGALRRERGGRRDYYFVADVTWEDRKLLLSLRSATERGILLTLAEHPRQTLQEISTSLRISLSTASFHLAHLVEVGLIVGTRDSNLRRYEVPNAAKVAELVSRYKDSFEDRLVDHFVETWSSLIR